MVYVALFSEYFQKNMGNYNLEEFHSTETCVCTNFEFYIINTKQKKGIVPKFITE